MKKKILISIVVLFSLFIIYTGYIFIHAYFKAPRYQSLVPSGTLSLDEVAQKGLHFQDMSIENGLTGWYERGDYIIYFSSKRKERNPWDERILFEAPEFGNVVIFSDNKRQNFIVSGLGINDVVNLPDKKRDSKIDQEEVNFILVLEMIEILKQTKIDPKLDYEYDAIVSGEESLKEDVGNNKEI